MGRMVHVVEGATGRSTDVDTHADLPKHAFGSCAICTRRLLAQEQARPTERRHATRRTVPTRFLVQTSAVPAPKDATA